MMSYSLLLNTKYYLSNSSTWDHHSFECVQTYWARSRTASY